MSQSKIKILSIDDSKAVHAFLDMCLKQMPKEFEIQHTYSVKEGLEVLKNSGHSISLVLLDWEMPEITGLEGISMIKGVTPKIPVIMVTTKNNPDDISQMLQRGAAEYIMKPFTPDILLEKLRSTLESQQ